MKNGDIILAEKRSMSACFNLYFISHSKKEYFYVLNKNLPIYTRIKEYIDTSYPFEDAEVSLRFSYKGVDIKEMDTPASLNMRDGDRINVTKMEELFFVCPNGIELKFQANFFSELNTFKASFAEQVGLDSSVFSIRFKYKGIQIKDNDTPRSLEMEDDD